MRFVTSLNENSTNIASLSQVMGDEMDTIH